MPSSLATTIARRLRDARAAAGLTQAQLAEAAGVTDETVSRIERGTYEPAVSTVVALADALGTSVDALVGLGSAPAPSVTRRTDRLSSAARLLAMRASVLDRASLRVVSALVDLLARARATGKPRKGRLSR